MSERKLLQKLLSAQSKSQQDLAAVRLSARTPDQAFGLEPVGQFDRAVMLNLQALSQDPDRCNLEGGQSLDHQQRLVLMRLDPGGPSGRFAEVQEAADLVTEIGQRRVVNLSSRDRSHDTISISYYDIIVQEKPSDCLYG